MNSEELYKDAAQSKLCDRCDGTGLDPNLPSGCREEQAVPCDKCVGWGVINTNDEPFFVEIKS